MAGKPRAEWHTPLCSLKNREAVWQKIETKGWAPVELDTSKPITFFNNPLKYQWSAEYDRFFDYTKIFPLWDQRKPKDNTQYQPDIHENIYQQEGAKPVPALTSQNYGLAARGLLDFPERGFRRIHAMADFSRRRGVMRPIERRPQ